MDTAADIPYNSFKEPSETHLALCWIIWAAISVPLSMGKIVASIINFMVWGRFLIAPRRDPGEP